MMVMNKATFWGWFMVNYKGMYEPNTMDQKWSAVSRWLGTTPSYPHCPLRTHMK